MCTDAHTQTNNCQKFKTGAVNVNKRKDILSMEKWLSNYRLIIDYKNYCDVTYRY